MLVDGDVRVAPEGQLVIHHDTRVRFAGTDQQRAGQDPSRIELTIQGSLTIRRSTGPGKVIFEAQQPGEHWYGIRLELSWKSRIEVPAGSYEVRDASRGIAFLDAPAGVWGLHADRFQVRDTSGSRTMGNGDGQLNPGELFQLMLSVNNWSLSAYRKGLARVRWDTRLILPPWDWDIAPENQPRGPRLFMLSLEPGMSQELDLPLMALSPEAQPGQKVEFFIDVSGEKGHRWKDTLVVPIMGRYPDHEVVFEVPDRAMHDQVVVVPSGGATRIRALCRGRIQRVDWVLRSVQPAVRVLEGSMVRQPDQGNQQVFEAVLVPPAEELYQIFLRLRSADGAVVRSRASLYVLATPTPEEFPVLAFSGFTARYGYSGSIRQMVEEVLAGLDLRSQVLDLNSGEEVPYQVLLAPYGGAGELVVWMGQTMDEGAQDAFRAFLQRGGRLVLMSAELHRSPDMGRFMEEVLHARMVDGPTRRATVRSVPLPEPVEFMATHPVLDPLDPAEPVLLNSRGEVAGLRVDTGTYQVVYLPFDLSTIRTDLYRSVVELSVLLLPEKQVREPRPETEPVALEISAVVAPATRARVEPLVPQLVLANAGSQISDGFRVGYQILQGDQVMAAAMQEEKPLVARTERRVRLPIWEPVQEGEFFIRFGLSTAPQGELTYGPLRPLQVVDVRAGTAGTSAVAPWPAEPICTGWKPAHRQRRASY